jgi:hypothetical protein
MNEIKPHLKVVRHPNVKCRTFHVVREICLDRGGHGFGREDEYIYGRSKEPGDLAKGLAKTLETIPGVASGSLKQYEIRVDIADAFSWEEIGPMVLGEIVKAIYPDVVGNPLLLSVSIGWGYYVAPGRSRMSIFSDENDDYRTRYIDTVKRQPIEVDLGKGRPMFNIEHLLNDEVLAEAKIKADQEMVAEDDS